MGWRAIVLSGIGNIAGPEASWPRLETNGRNHMAEKKILITGATGATGGNAITKLLELKVPVRAFVHQNDARSEQSNVKTRISRAGMCVQMRFMGLSGECISINANM